jgi:hypothetical protein
MLIQRDVKRGVEVAMNTNDPNPANKVTVLETNLTTSLALMFPQAGVFV